MVMIKQQGTRFQVSAGFGVGVDSGTVTAANTFEVSLAVNHFLKAPHGPQRCPACRDEQSRRRAS